MAFDFPPGPANGDVYTSVDGVTYTFNGYAWMKGGGTGAAGGGPDIPPVGDDGEALVAQTGFAVWGAPINAGSF